MFRISQIIACLALASLALLSGPSNAAPAGKLDLSARVSVNM
jgi:hypothetical protein